MLILITLLITIPLGVKAIVIGSAVTSAISFFINAYMPGRLFGYGAFAQIKDMIPVFIATGVMALVVYIVGYTLENNYLRLILGGISGLVTYGSMAYILKIEEVDEVRNIINKIKIKK